MFNSLLSAVGHGREVRITTRNNRGQISSGRPTKIASQKPHLTSSKMWQTLELLGLMEATALGQKLFFSSGKSCSEPLPSW